MVQFGIDYSALEQTVNQKKSFKLSGLAPNSITRFAWDVVRFKDENIDGLWQIKADPESGDYIVALYEDFDPAKSLSKLASASPWQVYADGSGQQFSFLYKNVPILRIASSYLGISPEEAHEIATDLPAQLQTNAELRNSLINEIPPSTRNKITSQFPELKVQ